MDIKVNIEKNKQGIYWGTTQNIPGVVVADGKTIQELKVNLKEAIDLYVAEVFKDNDTELKKMFTAKYEFIYKLNISELFEKLEVINRSAFARRIGINANLLRQYATIKDMYISEKRAKKIQDALHDLGEELQTIRL